MLPSMAGREKKAGSSTRSVSSPRGPVPAAPSPPPTAKPPPRPIEGWWTGSDGSSGASQPPQGNPSPNPWCYPHGGFVNFLQQPQFPRENFHFVGLTPNLNTISPSLPPITKGQKASINIDSDDGAEASRSARKRHWTHEEEVRLASAWLNNSVDPIKGNDRKGDAFWRDITDDFNKNAQSDRRRDTNQLKIHWTRLKTTINDFQGCWSKVSKINKSGYFDDQLMDDALKMYEGQYKKPFTLVHWWRTLKNQPKWCAYAAQLEKEKNKSSTISDDRCEERPIGREAAKAERSKKRKSEEIMDGIVLLGENISKIVEVQKDRKVEREKVTETQLEISRLTLKAAKEQKEAKLLEAYNSLLNQDTSQMTEQAKANRQKTLERMELKLFSDNDDV